MTNDYCIGCDGNCKWEDKLCVGAVNKKCPDPCPHPYDCPFSSLYFGKDVSKKEVNP